MKIVLHTPMKTVNALSPITGYTLWLSADDTYNWARRPGAAWPCSTTSHNRLVVEVDSNGLCGLAVNGKDDNGEIDSNELEAIVADHLPTKARHLWPTWGVK